MLGPNGEALPGSVLFACTHNAIRSPMAESIMKHLFGRQVYVDSCGARPLETDGFAIEAMDEIGIDLSRHTPKSFDDLEDTYYDLVISLSPEAQHKAVELTRTMSVDLEYWPMLDPSAATGNREQRLEMFRQTRDMILKKIKARFSAGQAPTV